MNRFLTFLKMQQTHISKMLYLLSLKAIFELQSSDFDNVISLLQEAFSQSPLLQGSRCNIVASQMLRCVSNICENSLELHQDLHIQELDVDHK